MEMMATTNTTTAADPMYSLRAGHDTFLSSPSVSIRNSAHFAWLRSRNIASITTAQIPTDG